MAFHRRFLGREREIDALQEAWRVARSGCPQFVLLLGDSGLGKTRLIHEFYHRISVEENAGADGTEGYWPDVLDPDPVSLRINPDLTGRELTGTAMPWLWWGLRWQEPGTRNAAGQGACALLDQDAERALMPHREYFHRVKQRATHGKKMLGGAAALVVENVPIIGDIWGVVDKGMKVIEIAREGLRVRATGVDSTISAAALWARRDRDATAAVREFLVAVLDPTHEEVPTRPVILVLDDAQWADPRTLGFVRDLLRDAIRYGWSLLVLCTCWETAWKDQKVAPASALLLRHDPDNLRTLGRQLDCTETGGSAFLESRFARIVTLSRFKRGDALRPLIVDAFPGLGEGPQQYLLNLASGNPRVLVELLLQLKGQATSDWFVGGTSTADLTPHGFARLRMLPSTYEAVVVSRVRSLETVDRELFSVLAIATLQGMRFHGALVAAIARQLEGVEADAVVPTLYRGETPHNFVSLFPGETCPAEFKERFAWKALEGACRQRWPSAEASLCAALLAWLDGPDVHNAQAAPDYLESLAALLNGTDVSAELAARRPCVLGHLVAVLVARERHAEAAARALEVWVAAGAQPAKLLAETERSCWFAIATAFFLDRQFRIAAAIAGAVGAESRAGVGSEMHVLWRELQAKSEYFDGQYAEAVVTWNDAIEGARQVYAANPLPVVRLTLGLARSRAAADGAEQALKVYEQALERMGDTGSRGDDPAVLMLLGQIREGMAAACCDAGRLTEALELMGEATRCFARCQTLVGSDRDLMEALAQCLNRIGEWHMYDIGGNVGESIRCFRRALALEEALVRRTGETSGILTKLAATQTWLARALARNGEFPEAHTFIERALAHRTEIVRRVGERPDTWRGTAISQYGRGDVLLMEGKPERAIEAFEAARDLRQRVVEQAAAVRAEQLRRDIRYLGYAYRKLGEASLAAARPAAARESLESALKINLRIRRQFSPAAGRAFEPEELREAYMCWAVMGEIAAAEADQRRARRCYLRALQWIERLAGAYGLADASRREEKRIRGRLKASVEPVR